MKKCGVYVFVSVGTYVNVCECSGVAVIAQCVLSTWRDSSEAAKRMDEEGRNLKVTINAGEVIEWP